LEVRSPHGAACCQCRRSPQHGEQSSAGYSHRTGLQRGGWTSWYVKDLDLVYIYTVPSILLTADFLGSERSLPDNLNFNLPLAGRKEGKGKDATRTGAAAAPATGKPAKAAKATGKATGAKATGPAKATAAKATRARATGPGAGKATGKATGAKGAAAAAKATATGAKGRGGKAGKTTATGAAAAASLAGAAA
jgi:hypothetical protein